MKMNRICGLAFLSCAATGVLACPVFAQITPPSGWVVDQVVGRLDNTTPRLTAVTDAAFRSGVLATTVSNGILTVRRIGVDGALSVIASIGGMPPELPIVNSVLIDDQHLLGGDLFVAVSVARGSFTIARTLIFRIEPDGDHSLFADTNDAAQRCYSMSMDLAPMGSQYGPLFIAYDANFCGDMDGTELLTLSFGGVWTTISNNSLPAGRDDLDTVQLAFDRGGQFDGELLIADSDTNHQRLSAIYALRPDFTWRTVAPAVPVAGRQYGDMVIGRGGKLGTSAFLTEIVTNTVQSVTGDGAHATWASGFSQVLSLAASADGNAMYVSDFNGVYRIRPVGNESGPTLVCREPVLPGAEPFRTPSGIGSTRLIWSAPVSFEEADIAVVDSGGVRVPFSVSGSGSAFMLISFGHPLYHDSYTITVRDSVVGAISGAAIDGNDDGTAGGDAMLLLQHICPADHNGDGAINSQDFFDFLAAFFAGC